MEDLLVKEERKVHLAEKIIDEFMKDDAEHSAELVAAFHNWLLSPGHEEYKERALYRAWNRIVDEYSNQPLSEESYATLYKIKQRLNFI